MKNEDLAFWADVAPTYKAKETHCRSIKDRKRRTGFAVFYGEIPTGIFNSITQKFMPVENTRGLAYACRKRLKYRNKKNSGKASLQGID